MLVGEIFDLEALCVFRRPSVTSDNGLLWRPTVSVAQHLALTRFILMISEVIALIVEAARDH